MAIQQKNKYYCGFCGKEYKHAQEADACKLSHNLVYVPFTLTELNQLQNYIFTGNPSFYDDKVMQRLRTFTRQAMTLTNHRK